MIFLLQQRICLAKDMTTLGSVEDIKRMEEEICRFRYDIEMMKGQRLADEEVKKLVDPVVKALG